MAVSGALAVFPTASFCSAGRESANLRLLSLSVTAACSRRRALAEVPGVGGSGRGWQGAAVSSPTPSSRLTGSDPGGCTPAGKVTPC